ncbi:hypothetical protein HDZ31DRAFT_75668 [Schizophyllum fasciatum]
MSGLDVEWHVDERWWAKGSGICSLDDHTPGRDQLVGEPSPDYSARNWLPTGNDSFVDRQGHQNILSDEELYASLRGGASGGQPEHGHDFAGALFLFGPEYTSADALPFPSLAGQHGPSQFAAHDAAFADLGAPYSHLPSDHNGINTFSNTHTAANLPAFGGHDSSSLSPMIAPPQAHWYTPASHSSPAFTGMNSAAFGASANAAAANTLYDHTDYQGTFSPPQNRHIYAPTSHVQTPGMAHATVRLSLMGLQRELFEPTIRISSARQRYQATGAPTQHRDRRHRAHAESSPYSRQATASNMRAPTVGLDADSTLTEQPAIQRYSPPPLRVTPQASLLQIEIPEAEPTLSPSASSSSRRSSSPLKPGKRTTHRFRKSQPSYACPILKGDGTVCATALSGDRDGITEHIQASHPNAVDWSTQTCHICEPSKEGNRRTSSGMSRHIQSAHLGVKYICPGCDARFARSDVVAKHLRSGNCPGTVAGVGDSASSSSGGSGRS